MIKVYNMLGKETVEFGADVSPLWAVVYCWCEQNKMLSALFSANQGGTFDSFVKKLPIFQGKISIGCGDWVARYC